MLRSRNAAIGFRPRGLWVLPVQTSPDGVATLQQRVAVMGNPSLNIVATIVGLRDAQVRFFVVLGLCVGNHTLGTGLFYWLSLMYLLCL